MPATPPDPHPARPTAPFAALALSVLGGLGTLGALVIGCDQGREPTREWQASDHTHAAGSAAAASVGQAAPPPPNDGLAPEDRAAQSLFMVSCASCHGPGGRGDGPSRAPIMRIPDFTTGTWQASRTDEEVASVIALGRGMMPAFGDRLPRSGIDALVRRVRRFAPPEPEPEPQATDGGVVDDAVGEEATPPAEAVQAPEAPPEAPTEAPAAPAAP